MADEVELVGSGTESGGGASSFDEVAPLESQDTEQRQPKPQVDLASVDLSQLPQFREYQSRADRRLAMLEQEAAQAKEEARLAKMAGMDDFEKLQYERDEYANRFQTLAQQVEQQRLVQEAAAYRDQQLRAISQETGVPVNMLNPASPDDAWRSAIQYLKQQPRGEATPQPDAPRPAHTVDLGGGSPQTADARYRARINQLTKQKAPATDIYKLMLGNS